MTKIDFHPVEEIEDSKIRFAVCAARFQNQWLFCRHRERSTWEIPGGHRECDETALEAALRELKEETGAVNAQLKTVCVYSVARNGVITYGLLCYAVVETLGELSEIFEIEEIRLADSLPEQLTYPDIQPTLFSFVQTWMNLESSLSDLRK